MDTHERSQQSIPEIIIEEHDRIDTDEALLLARQHGVALPVSTLRRWLYTWRSDTKSPVKCVLGSTSQGNKYWISKDDWIAHLYDIKDDRPLGQNSQAPISNHEHPQEPMGDHQRSREPMSDHERSDDSDELQEELNELRFEYRVKDELFRQARKQIGQLTDDRDQFMSMIGGFQLKLRQLGVANDEILQLTSPQSGEPARPGQGTEADFVPEEPNPTNPQSSPEASSDQLL